MLPTLRSLFHKTPAVEKEAIAIWNNGEMEIDWRMPDFGKRWKEEYYPFFRRFALLEREYPVCNAHATIDDEVFWRNASSKFGAQEYVQALNIGGQYGCLSMFNVFPEKHVQVYADSLTKALEPGHQRQLVHPDTVGWLRQHRYLEQAHMDGLGRDYSFTHPACKRLTELPKFLGTVEQINAWAIGALQQHRWSADVQAQVVGHLMMTFQGHFIAGEDAPIKKHLDPDVDIAMLAAVCGMTPSAFSATGPVNNNSDMALVYDSVQQMSQHCRLHVWGPRAAYNPGPLAVLEFKGGHPGLNLLLELAPPERPMDLYRMALGVQRKVLGQEKVETFALPELTLD